MRTNVWPRHSALASKQRLGAARVYPRGGVLDRFRTASPLLDVTLDVTVGDVSGTVRIVEGNGHRAAFSTDPLAAELDVVDRATPSVVTSRSSPFRAEMRAANGRLVTTSPRARQLETGEWETVHYRERTEEFETKEAQDELLLGRLAAAAMGTRQVFASRQTLGSAVFLANVSIISVYRTVVPTIPQRAKTAKIVQEGAVVPLGELASALHPVRVNGFALAYALMLRRCVAIDLEAPLGPESSVRAVTRPPEVMPGLFDRVRVARPLA